MQKDIQLVETLCGIINNSKNYISRLLNLGRN
jgi:hypothetical protein